MNELGHRGRTVSPALLTNAAPVAASVLVLGDEARRYFTLIDDTSWIIGSIGAWGNQSWRAGISRILGHDAGYGPPVLVAIAATAVLMVSAWRAIGTSDRLGGVAATSQGTDRRRAPASVPAAGSPEGYGDRQPPQ